MVVKDNMTYVESDDSEMLKAIARAKVTLKQFDSALSVPKEYDENFSIKVKFITNDGAEHIWVNEIQKVGGRYQGLLDEDPVYPEVKYKAGDVIKFDKDSISDWLFVRKGVLQGGFTIRLLRQRMSEAERKQFDLQYPYKIVD